MKGLDGYLPEEDAQKTIMMKKGFSFPISVEGEKFTVFRRD